MRSHVTGCVYLLHFNQPYIAMQRPGCKLQFAQHYLGFSQDLVARLTAHSNGSGARLVRVAKDAGIDWELARVWKDVTRFEERRLKKQGGRGRLWPLCRGTGTAISWQTPLEVAV